MANTEILEKILGNDLCAKWINLRDYAFDKLSSNADIKAIMDVTDKKIVAGVPKLSSNTGTNGEASADRVSSSSYDAWKVFDDDDSTFWMTGGSSAPHWIQYKFNDPVCVKRVYFKESSGYSSGTFTDWTYKIQGSNDGTNWTDLTETLTAVAQTAINSGITISLENNNNYLYYRYYGLVNNRENASFQLCSLQFYIEQTSTKYGLGEWVCEGQVPVMTSNTAPYGECIADSEYSGQNAWKAFDNDDTSYWASSNSANGWCGYHFIDPVIVKRVMFYPMGVTGTLRVKNYKIQGSNDGTTWTDLTDTLVADNKQKKQYVNIDNDTPYSYYRMFIIDSYGQDTLRLGSLQFYAYQPKGNVPIMTSNTAPYGEASAYSSQSGHPAYMAFKKTKITFSPNDSIWWQNGNYGGTSWLQYKFVNPICVKRCSFIIPPRGFVRRYTSFIIKASNDGTNFKTIYTSQDLPKTYPADNVTYFEEFNFENDGFYLYYRLETTCDAYGKVNIPEIASLQFYGREMKSSVPYLMNQSNIDNIETAQGMVLGSAQVNASYKAAYAFKGDNRRYSYWSASLPAYVGYKFKFPFVMKKLCIGHYSGSIASVKNGYLQASNNGTDWVNIIDVDDSVASSDSWFDVDNDNPYYYWRLYAPDSYYNGNQLLLGICQFFGFDYSERDWDTEHPMRYLYDHGVELEEMESDGNVIKYSDYVLLNNLASGNSISFGKANFDLTDYKLWRNIIEDEISGIASTWAALQVRNGGTISAPGSTQIATKYIQQSEFPRNVNLNIESINAEYLIFIGQRSGNVWKIRITEWWLE